MQDRSSRLVALIMGGLVLSIATSGCEAEPSEVADSGGVSDGGTVDGDGGGGDAGGARVDGGAPDAGGGGVPAWVDDYPLDEIAVIDNRALTFVNLSSGPQWAASATRGDGLVSFPVRESLSAYEAVSATTLIRVAGVVRAEQGASRQYEAATSLRTGTFIWDDGFGSYSNGGFRLMTGSPFANPDMLTVSADIGGPMSVMVGTPPEIDTATLLPPPGDGLSSLISLEDGSFDLLAIQLLLEDGSGGTGTLLRYLRPGDMALSGTTRSAPLVDAAGLAAMTAAGLSAADNASPAAADGLLIRVSREVASPFGPGGRTAYVRATRQFRIRRPGSELSVP